MDDYDVKKVGAALVLTGVFVFASILSIMLITPIAEAGDDQVVDIGELVQFDGSSSTNAAQYWWNFRDDGWCNRTVSPTRTYHTEGVYFVGLLVIASNGQQSLDTVQITVRNDLPIAFAGQDITSYKGESVTFDGSATFDSPIDMPNLDYSWDFGDGCNASGISATHGYQNAGIYQALLSVTDDQGAIGRSLRNVTILNKGPTATISDAVTDEGTAFSIRVCGNDTVIDEQSLRYEWDNGKYGEETSYRYDQPGEYHPQVTVRDDNNATAVATGNVFVRNVAPITGILGVSAKTNLSVNITLRASGEKWHDLQLFIYSDGSLVGNASAYRVQGDPNTQEVTITDFIFNLKSSYQIITYYTPEDDPVNGQIQGATPAWITFSFADGSNDVVNHNFNVEQQGTWIWDMDPIPYLCGHAISFEGFAFDPGFGNLTTTWDFGDGTILTDIHSSEEAPSYAPESIVHSFPSIGTYTVRLCGIDNFGESGEFSLTITIDDKGNVTTGNLAPRVMIRGSIGTVTENMPACLIASAEDDSHVSELSYQWFFGDGSSSSGQLSSEENTAFHSYNFSGTYVVTIIAKDGQNAAGIAYTTMRIENTQPTAIISSNKTWCKDRIAFFNGSSSYDTSSDQGWLTYVWNLGDGTILIGKNVTHVYESIGLYNVTLAVIDNDGAVDITTMGIEILVPTPPRAILTDKTIYGPAFALTFSGVGDAAPSEVFDLSYDWDFGDGSPIAVGNEVTHTYANDGLYQVTLTVTDRYGQASNTIAFVNVVIDTDGDSLTDAQETNEGTDSTNPDTDGDSIIDYWELYVHDTNPTSSDSDDDGVNDWYEAIYFGYNVDTDNDSLMNPWDPDSDNDGIIDGNDSRPLIYDTPNGTALSIIETSTSTADSEFYGMTVVIAVMFHNAPLQAATVNTYSGDQGQGQQVAAMSAIGNDAESEQQIARISNTNTVLHWISFHYRLGPKLDSDHSIMPTFDFNLQRNDGNPLGDFDISIDVTYSAQACADKGMDWRNLHLYQYNLYWDWNYNYGYHEIIPDPFSEACVAGPVYINSNSVHAELSYSEKSSSYFYKLYQLGDASNMDHDYDGLSDLDEITYHRHGGNFDSDPYDPDKDKDGLFDGWNDVDHDMVWDAGEEYGEQGYYGVQGLVGGYGTDPMNPDFDLDGLFDGWNDANGNGVWDSNEVKGEIGDISLNAGAWGTNPKNPDTDNDGLYDGWVDSNHDRKWDWIDINNNKRFDPEDSWETKGEVGDANSIFFFPAKYDWEEDYYLNVDSSTHTNPLTSHSDADGMADGSDFDAIQKDIDVSITINEIVQLDNMAGTEPNFYWNVWVGYYDGAYSCGIDTQWSGTQAAAMRITPYWTMTCNSEDIPHNVLENSPYIYIDIALYDDEDGDGYDSNEIVDIAANSEYSPIMRLDLRTGLWDGGDGAANVDHNGRGRVSGMEDGSLGDSDRDCELFFDISISDFDSDGLPYWTEINWYGTNPTVFDDDGDGLPASWEMKYNIDATPWDGGNNNYRELNPILIDTDADGIDDNREDIDLDRMVNSEEYSVGTNPSLFEVNLVVGTEWDLNQGLEMALLKGAIEYASDILYDLTDGYLYLRTVTIFDTLDLSSDYDGWYQLLICEGHSWVEPSDTDLSTKPWWPHASGTQALMPRYRSDLGMGSDYWKHTLCHELGHSILGLPDEYDDTRTSVHEPECGGTFYSNCIMHNSDHFELCYHYDNHHNLQCGALSCWSVFHNAFRQLIWMDLDNDGIQDGPADQDCQSDSDGDGTSDIIETFIPNDGPTSFTTAPYLIYQDCT